ncbi:MAG: restriction endonuclease subunit S [Muribaculaceae bacterium]|nr:restriction endonuclease subunit S [Muribaculaceae bacterium]
MKQGWEIRKLSDVASKFFAGKDKPVEFSEQITNTHKIPVYANGVNNNGLCGYTDKALVEQPCITISARGTIGFCCIRKEPFVPIVRLITIIPNDNISIEYLYYAISNINFENNGVAIPQLTIPMIKGISIPVPPLSEQQRIVDILDREFAKIEALKDNARKCYHLARDLFQSALKQELQPKEGWIISTLQSLLKLTSGDNLTAKSIIKGEYPVYGGNGIMGYHNQYNLDGLNVIVGRVGALCGNVRLVEGKIWHTDNAFWVHDKNKLFYLPYLTYELRRANLRQYATQAAQPVVSNASMKDVLLSVPPSIKMQEQIVVRLDILNEKCKSLKRNYLRIGALCEDMKQALLRKAFSGEL